MSFFIDGFDPCSAGKFGKLDESVSKLGESAARFRLEQIVPPCEFPRSMRTNPTPDGFLRGWIPASSRFWRLQLTFWGLVGFLGLTTRASLGEPLLQALVFTVVVVSVCVFISLLLRRIYLLRDREFDIGSAAILITASLAASIAQTALLVGFAHLVGWHNTLSDFFVNVVLRVVFMWVAFMAWSLGYFWIWSEADRSLESDLREQAQREAQRMELLMLRAQLDPHFLFNSLNAIAAEIPSHPDAATEMVNELSDYLRYSLDHRKDPFVPLSAEVRAMEAYLHIQRARFGERLHFSIDLAPDAAPRPVPCFLLQPLVENAVKHGLDRRGSGVLAISLSARRSHQTLEIRVRNSGSIKPHDPSRTGVGLETLRRRLEIHYPGRHTFRFHEKDGEVVAELDLEGEPCSA